MPASSQYVRSDFSPRSIRVAQSQVRTALLPRLEKVGRAVVARMKKNVSIPTATHGPSEPGEYPHADTRQLIESIHHVVHVSLLGVEIIADAPHARHLELGTSAMAPRPFLRRTIQEMRNEISRILQNG